MVILQNMGVNPNPNPNPILTLIGGTPSESYEHPASEKRLGDRYD